VEIAAGGPIVEAQVLVITQDPGTRESLSFELTREGFRIVCAAGIEEGQALARTRWPDLIILDILDSDTDPDILSRLTPDVRAPILTLGDDDASFKLVCLELGASAYLSKPVSIRELVARMRALLRPVARRDARGFSSAGVTVGDLSIDVPSRRVWRNGTLLRLRPKEFDLLLLLTRAPGRVWTREEILGPVWGESFAGDSRTVDVHIRWLREKIEPDPSAPQLLQTVRGVGYRCADPATASSGPIHAALSSQSAASTLVSAGGMR
jgi:DNA-binding response OmpR family regulator